MKRIISLVFLIAFLGIANAANVALVVEMPDGTIEKQCVNVEKDTSAYDILQKSRISFTWASGGVYGHALCKVEGKGDDVSGTVCVWGNEFWSFFIYDGGWQVSPVGFDTPGGCWNLDYGSFTGHYCARHGDVIGLARASIDPNSTFYNNEPPVVEFESICGLAITDIDVKVDGDTDKNLEDGDTIGEKAKPGSSVNFDVEVSNLFSSADDIEIEDVTVTVTIFEIDDGDDLEEEADEFDLTEGKDKSVDLSFKLPMIVDENDFEVLIEAVGDGTDGITYKDEALLTLRVKKDKHAVDIRDFTVTPAVLRCDRRTTATIEVINLGREDEDDVAFEIRSDVLDILITQKGIELEADDEDDAKYRESFLLQLDDAKPGEYTITARSFYDATKESDTDSMNILIEACGVEPEEEEIPEEEEEVEEEGTALVVKHPVTEIKYAQPKAGIDTITILLIAANIVIIVIIAALLSVVFRKK